MFQSNSNSKSKYSYRKELLNNKEIGIVIDKDITGYLSVTNNIENICDEINVEACIYRDSQNIYDFWSKKSGFVSLAVEGEATNDIDIALIIANERVVL